MSELMRVGDREMVPQVDENGEVIAKPSIVAQQSEMIMQHYNIISFNNRAMYRVDDEFPHYIALTKERFDRIAYNLLNGPTRSRVGDLFVNVANVATDLTENSHLILLGLERGVENPNHPESIESVWDTRALTHSAHHQISPDLCVWRSPYAPISLHGERLPFIMQLAGGNESLYDDIFQSIAPMVMEKKPDGVIWWIGSGANGKSTLMDVIYRCFPGQLASLTVKALTDGRDTPNLNGNLANIVRESSEGRVDDTEVYKAIGTHENFVAHKFHSQETITIRGNMHHIFSGNSIPVFNDKGFSARRRTFIIPFDAQFESDPTFEERLFTPEFFGQFMGEVCRYAQILRKQGYKYKWSKRTLGAKLEYDSEANTAENYATQLIEDGVVGFDNFDSVRIDYENWCRQEGQVALGVQNMRRAIQNAGFEKKTVREGEKTAKGFRLPTVKESDLEKLSMYRPGLYTTVGFRPDEDIDPTDVPEFPAEVVNEASEW